MSTGTTKRSGCSPRVSQNSSATDTRKVQLTQRVPFHAVRHAAEARASGRQELDRGDEQRAGAGQQEDGPELAEEERKREREQARAGVQQLARRFGTCGARCARRSAARRRAAGTRRAPPPIASHVCSTRTANRPLTGPPPREARCRRTPGRAGAARRRDRRAAEGVPPCVPAGAAAPACSSRRAAPRAGCGGGSTPAAGGSARPTCTRRCRSGCSGRTRARPSGRGTPRPTGSATRAGRGWRGSCRSAPAAARSGSASRVRAGQDPVQVRIVGRVELGERVPRALRGWTRRRPVRRSGRTRDRGRAGP